MPDSFLQDLCSLFGQPVAGNPAQFMMERAFAHHGLDWRFLSFEVSPESLGDAVRGMRALGFRGGMIDQPHRTAVVEYLDRLSDAASAAGAVNCVVRDGAELVGENTLGAGFAQALRGVADPAAKRAVVFDAGGAARAIALELARGGVADLTIVNRTAEHGQALAERVTSQTSVPCHWAAWGDRYDVAPEAQILVQASSMGLDRPSRMPISLKRARPDLVVADLVYSPPETALLAEAKEHNLMVLDGVAMLVAQGALAFERWTGITPDAGVMREAAEEFLSS